MLRRIALALSVVLLLSVVTPARAQDAVAEAGYVRLAMAEWKPRLKGKSWWYVALAVQWTDLDAGPIDATFMAVGAANARRCAARIS